MACPEPHISPYDTSRLSRITDPHLPHRSNCPEPHCAPTDGDAVCRVGTDRGADSAPPGPPRHAHSRQARKPGGTLAPPADIPDRTDSAPVPSGRRVPGALAGHSLPAFTIDRAARRSPVPGSAGPLTTPRTPLRTSVAGRLQASSCAHCRRSSGASPSDQRIGSRSVSSPLTPPPVARQRPPTALIPTSLANWSR